MSASALDHFQSELYILSALVLLRSRLLLNTPLVDGLGRFRLSLARRRGPASLALDAALAPT
jgi:hypothetical protein